MNHSQLLELALNKTALQSKTYQLKTITPLGVHGASGSQFEAEFRISSLRGVIRYWWRAVQHMDEPKELLQLETKKFGGTSVNAQKSPVAFVVEKPWIVRNYKKFVLPHKNSSPMTCLPEQKEIPVKMLVKRNEDVAFYENVFHLFSMLGSMGQRARRGFGSIQLSEYEDIDDFINELMRTLNYFGIDVMFNSSHSLKVRNYEKLSHPTIASIWFGRPYTSAWDVVIAYAKASSKNQTGMLGQVSDKKRNKKRFASPLWGSVKEIGGKYYPVITELQSQSITNMKKYENERNEFLEVLGVSI